jgi:chorismate synthase
MRFLTAGESHGPALTVVIEGCPAGLPLLAAEVDRQLARRQAGFGRGARQRIEKDRVEILSGIRHGRTLGSPIAFLIRNRDFENWCETMSAAPAEAPPDRVLTLPRPGHADLPGALKYARRDARDILERASARETAARVAAGAVARRLLEEAGIGIASCVTAIGPVSCPPPPALSSLGALDPEMPMPDPGAAIEAREAIRSAAARGDTLGGRALVGAWGVPPGLGSHAHWDRRLDARLAAHIMSVPSCKAVEIGDGAAVSAAPGSEAHDEIFYDESRGFYRRTNRAGGIEGGMTNGEEVRVTAYFKPLATLMKPLDSVHLHTKAPGKAHKERSDACAVPAAAVICEAVLALALAGALQEKCGGDSIEELCRNLAAYRSQVESF